MAKKNIPGWVEGKGMKPAYAMYRVARFMGKNYLVTASGNHLRRKDNPRMPALLNPKTKPGKTYSGKIKSGILPRLSASKKTKGRKGG